MKKVFVKTRNYKKFVALVEVLKSLPSNIPKLALVYGEHGLGKSQAIIHWVTNNDAVYVRATKGMTSRWLLSEIAEELGETPYWHTQETFILVENHLRTDPKIIVIDEVDYLIDGSNIETLRDLHDKTGVPIILVGMGAVDKKIARYKHFEDRLYAKLQFEHLNKDDIHEIITQISDIEFTDDAILFLSMKTNQFRQLIKAINKIEKLAKTNDFKLIDETILREILNERQNIKVIKKTEKLLA